MQIRDTFKSLFPSLVYFMRSILSAVLLRFLRRFFLLFRHILHDRIKERIPKINAAHVRCDFQTNRSELSKNIRRFLKSSFYIGKRDKPGKGKPIRILPDNLWAVITTFAPSSAKSSAIVCPIP